ncbi:hypothetical protein [Microbacterium sp. NIBRBAC000506063]|uniref:hypothetical protein n=1 Tax=Microbacterium sp. NIBRBAC000506063 TaxID=2734618 RepID=UPI001BB53E62|nr:hypothetical protein [Microbacterium sp. NIBRBAC000506063]QTV78986.1 hypothetical protein KAE78_07290 [Microbacterium sp. NIBRBAC000506063]
MIPLRPRKGANVSEKRIFDAFAGATGATVDNRRETVPALKLRFVSLRSLNDRR